MKTILDCLSRGVKTRNNLGSFLSENHHLVSLKKERMLPEYLFEDFKTFRGMFFLEKKKILSIILDGDSEADLVREIALYA